MKQATNNNHTILLDLAFLNSKQWSGGKARSVQLYELFEHNGYNILTIEAPDRPNKFRMLGWGIKGILNYGIYLPFCMTSFRTTAYNTFLVETTCKKHPHIDTWLIEGTGFGALQKVQILKKFNKKVLLAPANIESLAPYHEAWTHQLPILKRFQTELKYYRMSDMVYCISEEENWLLSIMGVKSDFLPYLPPNTIMNKIEQRRQEREKIIDKKGFFYFANFHNAPNVLGLKEFIAQGKHLNRTIKIAGLGINKIIENINGLKEFEVLGELNEQDLENELIHCEKVILNHYPTSGMLTRVIELQLSGIPIEGNWAALKGYGLIPNNISKESLQKHFQYLIEKSDLFKQ